ncbi:MULTISPECIES: ATP-dependent DNA ligase [unclassified Micromonospora]|uniref:ATP-dependent DNA ligase n=1 Tax=unclassified Micromonospora TaxID=2617518 RepID=UPI001890468D|nr:MULTISPECIES: ATP-dependent DNA ligase [unclassified Micromonospora]MBF5030745.1 ATP-dependent DNA ligase [Micromonospora sp. ANENR4]MCZ7477120.1 ATP-dependent DNA ligase [Micromonospora sp. WMMC273]WBC01911.1 ATP-dependent DNA ligase [Micromonospora sp. WMMA1976]
MRFAELAATSAAVGATSGRRAKVELLAAALRGLEPGEIPAGAGYLAGELRQRQTGVGWAGLRDLPTPAAEPTLTVGAVDAAIDEISRVAGSGSQARRRELVGRLFAAATADEQRLLTGLFRGELRQGAQAGLLTDAVARAADVPVAAVRRALLLAGDLRAVAVAALTGGAAALAGFGLQVGRPLAPMLAQSAPSVDEALTATGVPAVVDVKLDGIRIQVHRSGADIAVFTRSLDEITGRLPQVVAAVRALPARELVLDGEAIGLDAAGRPLPFQETSSRAARRATPSTTGPTQVAPAVLAAAERTGEPVLTPYFFDLLHLDGADLIDAPGRERWAALARAVDGSLLVDRVEVDDAEQAATAFAAAVDAGQEGVVVKDPAAPYDAGRRGSAWVKVKPRHTLDLVVLAVEWGSGRREGWLSNLHLGARDPRTGEFVMLGKTFKGLTDELLRWQTERFLSLAVEKGDWVVRVRPEQVVEIAFDGVQTSSRYPGGMALRFARVLRYRHDKTAAEADTIDAVRAIHAGRVTG